MDLDLAEKLLRLAVDASTTEEERRTAAMQLARMLHATDFLPTVRRLLSNAESMLKWFRDNRLALNRHGARMPNF